MKEHSFAFERGRGVVWVCDIQNSSKYLNDNELAAAIEDYLPRLHWLGKVVVDSRRRVHKMDGRWLLGMVSN